MRFGIALGVLLSIFCLLTAAQVPELGYVAQLGGTSLAVAVDGNVVYLGQGPRVVVLDASEPSAPKEIGRSEALPSKISDLVVVDGYAYVAGIPHGLRILSV